MQSKPCFYLLRLFLVSGIPPPRTIGGSGGASALFLCLKDTCLSILTFLTVANLRSVPLTEEAP